MADIKGKVILGDKFMAYIYIKKKCETSRIIDVKKTRY